MIVMRTHLHHFPDQPAGRTLEPADQPIGDQAMVTFVSCDACPASAKLTVGNPDLPAKPLALCMHHFNANAEALFNRGWVILDHLPVTTAAASSRIGVES